MASPIQSRTDVEHIGVVSLITVNHYKKNWTLGGITSLFDTGTQTVQL